MIGSIIFREETKSNFLNGILISLLGIIFFFANPINKFGLLSKTFDLANRDIICFDKAVK